MHQDSPLFFSHIFPTVDLHKLQINANFIWNYRPCWKIRYRHKKLLLSKCWWKCDISINDQSALKVVILVIPTVSNYCERKTCFAFIFVIFIFVFFLCCLCVARLIMLAWFSPSMFYITQLNKQLPSTTSNRSNFIKSISLSLSPLLKCLQRLCCQIFRQILTFAIAQNEYNQIFF